MQMEAPEIFDLSTEPQETLDMYGIGKEQTDDYGRRCLLARRLIEKGVRFVFPSRAAAPATCSGTRTTISRRTSLRMAAQTDQPVAALIKDLKRRGLLDSTLVDDWRRIRPVARIPGRQGTRPSPLASRT